MEYCSTRGNQNVDLASAVMQGLAPDGGLFVPDSLPRMSAETFEGCHSLAEIGARLLEPLFRGFRTCIRAACDL